MTAIQTKSREALRELIDLLVEVDERWASPEWNLHGELDIVNAHRALMHLLEGGLVGYFESDPAAPVFRRIVTPTRKFTGDNADAIYFDAPVSDAHVYRVRGEMNGAVYVSITVETGTGDGSLGARTSGILNDLQFDVDAAGSFEIRLGGAPQDRNWLALPKDASRITTRHYFEEERCAAANPARVPRLRDRGRRSRGPAAPALGRRRRPGYPAGRELRAQLGRSRCRRWPTRSCRPSSRSCPTFSLRPCRRAISGSPPSTAPIRWRPT